MAEETIANSDWTLVPLHLHDEMERWLCFGTMPRSRFLLALLADDMIAAELVADPVEYEMMGDTIHFLKTDAPGLAFGSLSKMLLWEFLGGLAGREVDEMVATP